MTLKIDGVRALWREKDGQWMWVSRADKPLYNIPPWRPGMPTDCEVYLSAPFVSSADAFKRTIRAVRSKTIKTTDGCKLKKCKCVFGVQTKYDTLVCPNWELATPVIRPENLYSLDPVDKRLKVAGGVSIRDPEAYKILDLLKAANGEGYEGLVLRQGDKWLKVKPEETYDVLITGVVEGKGKHKGRLGALKTTMGEVGTGFTDEERQAAWRWFLDGCHEDFEGPLIGQTIEVACMHLTPDGQFRHPRFVRFRPDKIAEK